MKCHTETGPGYQLNCWCEIGHDHTFVDFVEFFNEDTPILGWSADE